MKSEFLLAFNQICSERGLPPEVVLDALRTALVSAYRRNTNISSAQNVAVEIDPTTGQASIYVEKEAVEEVHNPDTEVAIEVATRIDPDAQLNDTVMVESTPKDFGRIAAQTAKQVILQRIREAEREALYEDYIGREGEIINGVVQSRTPQHVSLNLGRTEAILPRKEQVPGENYTLHQRLRAYVVEVRRSGRGPQIIVSRSHKNMLRRLLELEVPEIYNGAVEINAIAREAGARSKVAVSARQPGVDPVGSCVGMRGVRIQSIVNELGGEKIDVIEWDPDSSIFIAKALSPARVLAVHLEETLENGRTATVVVPDDQLSLAIGREGQNARLAAKLTGWRIDIKSVTEAARDALEQATDEQVRAELGNLVNLLPTAAAVLEHQRETHASFSTEQLLLLKQVIDGVHKHFAAKRRAERVALLDREASRRTAIAVEEAERRAEREKALAQVPDAAYDVGLEEIGLSTRVFNHLTKAEIENLGQIMERLVDGDEGLLALDGIGPKALTEVKSRIEAVAPVEPEEPEVEEPAAAEPETAVEPEPEPLTEEEPVVQEEVAKEVLVAAEAPVEAEAMAEVEPEEVIEPEAEPEAVIEPEAELEEVIELEAEPEVITAAEREKALAAIPADAYDIPLAVLALSGPVLSNLRKAQIENLGEVMELLAGGDMGLLALDGIDSKAVAEIKSQVEIMVSVPSQEPEAETRAEVEEDLKGVRFPRYEFVADDELERRAKPKRQRRQKQRRPAFDEDLDEVTSHSKRDKRTYDEWDDFDE
jgi:N utilization substance protein A